MTNVKKPLISIFVPTKNRYTYLKNLIELVEGFRDEKIELVIHDNSDDNSEILDYLNRKRLQSAKYYYHNGYLTMSQNSTMAFQHCLGEYVCMIGDDDAVCRNISECAQWMKDNDIDALRSANLHYDYSNTEAEHLLYWEDLSFNYKVYDPIDELKKILRKGLQDFGNISKPYHGIVKRTVMEEMLIMGETCFPGCTPDMSGAVASCFFVRRLAKVNIPVIIPAAAPVNSGGLSGQILSLEQVPWISQDVRDNWEKAIPRIWAREFIWPESGSKGLRYVGHEDMFKYFNFYMSMCRYLIMHKQYRKKVIQFAPSKFKLFFTFIKTILYLGLHQGFNAKVKSKFNGKLNGTYNYSYEFKNIFEVEKYFSEKNSFIFCKLKFNK